MTNEEINKWCHSLLGKCWHDWKPMYFGSNGPRSNELASLDCVKCGYEFETDREFPEDAIEDADDFTGKPDYCSDLNLAWSVVEYAVKNNHEDGDFYLFLEDSLPKADFIWAMGSNELARRLIRAVQSVYEAMEEVKE